MTLTIGSAESVVYAWVNGVAVGMGKDSRLPSEFEITPHLVAGENSVALAVVQWSDASWLEDQDQWWLPGMHRSVVLTCTAPTWIADLALVPALGENGAATLDAELRVGLLRGAGGRATASTSKSSTRAAGRSPPRATSRCRSSSAAPRSSS